MSNIHLTVWKFHWIFFKISPEFARLLGKILAVDCDFEQLWLTSVPIFFVLGGGGVEKDKKKSK